MSERGKVVPKPRTVAILGGGVGGMSAAHMLVRRGFKVTVYDRNREYVGGKARSVDVEHTNIPHADKYLPGEHGFRFFPGFYKHIFHTMRQIPAGAGKTVFDNLESTDTVQLYQIGKCPITIPLEIPTNPLEVRKLFKALQALSSQLTDAEVDFFSARIWQLMTSCKERFMGEYESHSWWKFTGADGFSTAYQQLLVQGLTRSLVAAKAQVASTRTIGTMFLQLLYTMIDGSRKNADRVLNAPTNDAWLTPWLTYLTSMGVDYRHGHEVTRINMESSTAMSPVESVQIRNLETSADLPPVSADYYVLAVPVDVASELINASPAMLVADPALQGVVDLAEHVEWMNGIQFFLDERFDMHRGHTIYAGSNWALTSISQIQFWPKYDLSQRYCGKVKGILSVDISDWTTPGNFNNKPARLCTRQQVIDEVWEQLKQEINGCGREILKDEMVKFVYLDDSIYALSSLKASARSASDLPFKAEDGIAIKDLENKEPMLVNLINTWAKRPHAYTHIPNLVLASDYVRTYSDLACMEGADEAARRATNYILDSSGSSEDPCELWPYRSPFPLWGFQALDKWRWNRGLPWRNPFPGNATP